MTKFGSYVLLVLVLLGLSKETWAEYNLTDYVIRPISLNTRGSVGPGRVCPPKEVAVGFRMKIQDFSEMRDNTALNAIRLICSKGGEVISSEGANGEWTDILKCQGKGDYVTGVKILTEKWQGWDEDDVGAIDFEGICSSDIRLRHRSVKSWIQARGLWSEERRCPSDAPAICGIKTRVDFERLEHETPDSKNDKAGLTGVQFKCCQVEKP
ncbi:vitelline membrane outer layer protein 1-like [Tigriopus californicus]|uniref:vitelline membrane outer layer protein 1-like n=1 Tax=Tigriopus californicus TaxID=6832 RepID=UPI0027DA68FD|nr:vitelline membrane outer layer protein 1-like [Tigriopus californicus]